MDDGETRFASSPPSQPHTPTPEDDPSVPLHNEDVVDVEHDDDDVDDEDNEDNEDEDDLDEESRRWDRRIANMEAAIARVGPDVLERAEEPIPGTMKDGKIRCAVFCIADIPLETLDSFFEWMKYYVSGPKSLNRTALVSDRIVIMDTKDVASITKGSSPPIGSCPTAFLGHSLKEVRDWFDANITQRFANGFMQHCFLVMDDKSAEYDTCIFVCTQDSAPGEVHSLRCGFEVALTNTIACEVQGESIKEGIMGSFMRSGVTMTQENLKLVEDGGLYYEGGEVKLSQYWRDFTKIW